MPSRAYTEEEIRTEFFNYVWNSIDYWAGEKGSNVPEEYDTRERLEGLTHSLLALLDGRTFFPAASPVVEPHPEDRAYHESKGENYYPPRTELTCLAELFHGHRWPTNRSERNPLNKKEDSGR